MSSHFPNFPYWGNRPASAAVCVVFHQQQERENHVKQMGGEGIVQAQKLKARAVGKFSSWKHVNLIHFK